MGPATIRSFAAHHGYDAIVAHPDEYLGVLLNWGAEEKEAAQ